MPGTSTIPTIASGATSWVLSMSWIDVKSGEYTSSFRVSADPSDAALQALVDAAQNGSNASSWKLEVKKVYEGDSNSGAATDDAYVDVGDKIRLSYKALSNGAYDQNYLPAPLSALIEDGGIVDTDNAVYQTWRDATTAIIQAGFTPLNVAFSEYSKRNDAITP